MKTLRYCIITALLGLCFQSCNKIVYEYQPEFMFYKNYEDVSLALPNTDLAVGNDSVWGIVFPDTNTMVKISDQATALHLHNILIEAWNESAKRRVEYNEFLLSPPVDTVKYASYFMCGWVNTTEHIKSQLVWKYNWNEWEDEDHFSLWLINLQGDSLRSVVRLSSFFGIGEDFFLGCYSPLNVTYKEDEHFRVYDYNLFSEDKWLCFPKHEYCLYKINESGYVELIPDTSCSLFRQILHLRPGIDEQRYNNTVKLWYYDRWQEWIKSNASAW